MEERDLEARVALLEERIESLEAALQAVMPRAQARPEPVSPPPSDATATQPDATNPAISDESDRSPIAWVVDKIGIALLLIGVTFLLKYSYDQGWLGEATRVALGGATGLALLLGGVHQRRDNPALSGVLYGGAIATFYGTVFAAYTLYALIDGPVALGLTVATTVGGFVLAARQSQAALASIATIGGFATPFVLEGGPGPVELGVFAILVSVSAGLLYVFRGWRSLLLTTATGGYSLVAAAFDALEFSGGPAKQWAAGIVASGSGLWATVLAFAALATVCVVTGVFPALRARREADEMSSLAQFAIVPGLLLPLVIVPLATSSTAIAVVVASVLMLGALAASRLTDSGRTYLVVAGVLAAAIVGSVFGVSPLALAFLGHAVAWGWLGAGRSDGLLLASLTALSGVGFWSVALLFEESGEAFGTPDSLILVFSTGALLALAFGMRHRVLRWSYFYLASFAAMAMFWSQLYGLPNSEGIVTVTWGVFAVAVLVAGFVRDEGAQQGLGVITVLATAGKLLVVDLASTSTMLRVGVFMAMGVALLFVSYLAPRLKAS
jgi:uncharacterized membrane protein